MSPNRLSSCDSPGERVTLVEPRGEQTEPNCHRLRERRAKLDAFMG